MLLVRLVMVAALALQPIALNQDDRSLVKDARQHIGDPFVVSPRFCLGGSGYDPFGAEKSSAAEACQRALVEC